MYELFLTALIEDADLEPACSILEGYCGMRPWETVHRVLYFQGPPKPAGIPNQTSIEKPIRKETAILWKELHHSLNRQSFILQTRYDLQSYKSWQAADGAAASGADAGSGGGGSEGNPAHISATATTATPAPPPAAACSDLNAIPGILRWTDFPDPPQGRPNIIQRKKVELWDQKKLLSVMNDNKHQFKTETVEELYRFYREDVEFCLSRTYFTRPLAGYDRLDAMQQQPPSGGPPVPASVLPPWSALVPVDAQRRWVLQVRLHVTQDNKPDEIRKAQDQLTAVRAEFEGVFDFRPIDRKVHDTRAAHHQQAVRTLPQKVTL